jgi:hypothetical protein
MMSDLIVSSWRYILQFDWQCKFTGQFKVFRHDNRLLS